jgi:hypothetical protein
MKTAVDKVQKGMRRIDNARFTAMCAHYLFDADFCNVASGWEKGDPSLPYCGDWQRVVSVCAQFHGGQVAHQGA